MIFDFKIKEDGSLEGKNSIWIDGKHRVFQGTEYEGGDFKVLVTPVTRTAQRKYRKESMMKSGFDADYFLSLIWINHVVGWEIKGSGGEYIPFSYNNKEFFMEQMVSFTKLVASCCIDAQVKEEEVKEEAIKNL